MTPLRDLGQWSGGNTPSKANSAYWDNGTVPWVSPKDMKVDEIASSEDRITDKALEDGRVSIIPAGAVLFVTRSGILAHTFPVAVTKLPVTINQDLKALSPKAGVSPKYVAHAVRGASQRILKECSKHGTTVASVDTRALLDFEIPMVAPDQQRRIVAEIEKQFSRVDESVANLQRVKVNLKRYKAAVLTAAVSGNLVEIAGVRATGAAEEPEAAGAQGGHGRKRNGKRSRDASSLGSLPAGWIWAEAANFASAEPNSICAGPFGTIFKAKDFRPAGVPIIFLRHVAPLRYLDRKPGFMDLGKWEKLFKQYSVYGGELLITKLGEPPGVCAMYPRGIGPAMVTPDVIKMNVDPSVASSAYVMYYFNSETAKRFATGAAFGTTRTRLTLPLFREMPVALPPLAEQHRIVTEVDRRLSIVREVEAEVDANLKRAQALRQAVLRRAFAGP